RVRDALPPEIPVTVKMRRGLDDSPASREWFYAILNGVLRAGAAAVTIHGRTVRQRYEGRSSWEFLREVKQYAGKTVVLGSGDLFTAADCLAMIEQTGVDGVAVARGAIGNPWIFGQILALASGLPCPQPSLGEQREVMLEHYRLAEETYGPRRAGPIMRKFGIKYAGQHPKADDVRLAFIQVRSEEDWSRVVNEWYG
ncbi:MAG: tRNA-dihydrouridine synthase, partial [Patescibacteria group bacterium]|nr:tRNA-dihydrouridine synthase [Patescibacteria group bacterium]